MPIAIAWNPPYSHPNCILVRVERYPRIASFCILRLLGDGDAMCFGGSLSTDWSRGVSVFAVSQLILLGC